jgi:hypothetical protein
MFVLGNCDIDFFNFCHRQLQNFPIWNHSKWGPNFAVNFWNHHRQKQKLTKCNESEQNKSITLWKFVRFHEILLDFMKFC